MKITKKFKGMLSLALSAMLTLGSVTANATITDEDRPVVNPDKQGSITIHKYGMESLEGAGNNATGLEDPDQVPENAVPLKDIEFTVQRVVADKNGELSASNSTDKYSAYSKEAPITITTDENGFATTGKIDQGIYLITESPNASVTTPVAPFIVNVPMTNPVTGEGWIYDVHVYPKNVLAGEASIDKDVTSEGNKHDTSDIGKNVTWIIKPSIPQDIFYSNKYAVVDQLDSQLNYTGSLEVYYYKGNEKVTIDKKYYTAIEPHKFKENEITGPTEGQVIKVEFNKEGREFLSSLFEKSINSIRISFTTTINESAELGGAIKNNANLVYTNSFDQIVGSDPTEPGNPDVPGEPDQPTPPTVEVPENQRPEVHTGGVRLIKVDANDTTKVLPGAKFMIYATLEDAKKGTNPLPKPGTVTPWVEESDANGYVIFEGLHYGEKGQEANSGSTTYWIVETESPKYDSNGNGVIDEEDKHYNLLKAPLEVTVNATSHEVSNKVVVANSKFKLPVTGGVGTVIFTLGGLAIMGAAAFLYMRTTRRA